MIRIINNFIFVIVLTLFYVDKAYDVSSRYIFFRFYLFILFIYLFVDVLICTYVIMRDNFLYLLVNQSMVPPSIIGFVEI